MKRYIQEISAELKKHVDLKFKRGSIRFFKEEINPIGVRTDIAKRIANNFYSKHKKEFSKKQWIGLCESLWEEETGNSKLPCMEYGMIVTVFMKKIVRQLEKKDFFLFERWIDKYITNWAHCDLLCSGAVGEIIRKHDELSKETLKWTKSKNRWKKRASSVCYIKLSKEKQFLPIIFKTAELLIKDNDDLVQKGYGWALKDASKWHRKEVIAFLIRNKDMPRTALRYACERLTKEEKQKILY